MRVAFLLIFFVYLVPAERRPKRYKRAVPLGQSAIWKQLANLSAVLSQKSHVTLADQFFEALALTKSFPINYQADVHEDVEKFVNLHRQDIQKSLSGFSVDGRKNDLGASAYNDFAKWTMMPVIRRVYEKKDVVCTFSVNIRDSEYRELLLKAYEDQNALWSDMLTSLRQVARRKFERDIFEEVVKEMELPGWDSMFLDFIAGQKREPRTLAQAVVASSMPPPNLPKPGEVVINVFPAGDNFLRERRIYIEATGPWPLVTWLETSMMQAVYDVFFRHEAREKIDAIKDSTWYPAWLAQAMLRCASSARAVEEAELSGVLSSGKRSGGMPLMILESMYLKYKLKEKLRRQASVTSWAILRSKGVNMSLISDPVGTHAHELSMVLSAVYSAVDDTCPLSQAIGHALYWYLSVPAAQNRGKMVMLPDTLSTTLFMRMAAQLMLRDQANKLDIPFIYAMGIARVGSGSLQSFGKVMDRYGFKGQRMASQIEKRTDLSEAARLGFTLFGAGGFFGDSLETWDDEGRLRMTVKVLRVYIGGQRSLVPPMKIYDDGGRIEIDGLLPMPDLEAAARRFFHFAVNCTARYGLKTELRNDLAMVMGELDVFGHNATL